MGQEEKVICQKKKHITKKCLMIIFKKQHREANKLRKQPRVLNPVVTSCRSHILISQSCRLMMEVGIGNHTTCNLRILPCVLNGQMPRNFTIFLYACEGKL